MKQKNTYIYDNLGRLTAFYWSAGRMAYSYKYSISNGLKMRRETIKCPFNISNHTVITAEVWSNNAWTPERRLEIGEKYNTYFKYQNKEALFIRRFNKSKKESFEKLVLKNSTGQSLWLLSHNGKKSVGFKIDPNKIK